MTLATSAAPTPTSHPVADRDYDGFRERIQARFLANLAEHGGKLFATDADGLFETYLDALPSADRQYHTCHACRRFFEQYAGLVTIDDAGRTRPALWAAEDAPDYYRPAVVGLAREVARAKVMGVFLSVEKVWGTPVTGPWTHFAVTPPAEILHRSPLLTASQAMAEKAEDYKNVSRALGEFRPDHVATALRILESDAMYRAEKVAGPAKWLHGLHVARTAIQGPARGNLVWRAIASAPAGFCHPRSSMVGTLLEDIAAGMDFAEVSRRFAAKMHPLQYQRPQAAPSAGNIAAAEAIIEKLGIARSLERRFARLEEVEAIWRPAPARVAPPTGGVFSHLKPKDAAPPPITLTVPPITMTWEKFARTVLPTADAIEYYAASGPQPFTALVTAAHADAPPILQWDGETGRRNPFSWYFWNGGSTPQSFGLAANAYHKVNAVAYKPTMWGDEPGGPARFAHHGPGVLFVIDGAKDTRMAGNALFPETLKGELHAVRSTIEAYSRAATIAGVEESSAAGVMLGKGDGWNARVRVTADGVRQEYRLDRWD